MADRVPLRLVNVNGTVTIGEFQSGDTVGVVHGGTGVSSIADLKDSLNYNLSALDDVSVGSPDALLANQIIVWNGTDWVNEYNDKTEMRVRNGTASAMSKGDVIAIEDAHNANLVNVILADASQTSAMPALGILEQDLAAGEEGIAITFGKAQGLNTLGLTEGATAYVSPTTPGGITTTKPTAGDHFIQNIGIVMRANASNGAIKVTGIGRANDIPNAEITTLSGDADYIYIDDGGVWKKITPTNLGVGSGGGGSASLSGLTDTNISSPSHNEALVWTSSTGEWINASLAGGGGVTDHGLLTGLSDNDHPQYVLTTTNSALSSQVDTNTSSIPKKVDKELVGHYIEPWEEGSGNQNAPLGWSTNGVSSLREFDTDPFGNQSIVWKAIDNDVTSDGEGGFISGKVPADVSSTYRFSCFIKQENTASGMAYFGMYAYSSLEGTISQHTVNVRGANAASGTGSTNPYFISSYRMPSAEWYLAVGYLHPYQTETGLYSKREETALYKASTGEKVSGSYAADRRFDEPTTVAVGIRGLHYYNPGGTGDVIQFFQPRIDIVDGNEPSIADLLGIVPRSDYVLSSTNSALSSLVTSVKTYT